MVQAIIFDLGSVLVEIDYDKFLNKLSKEFRVSISELIKNSPDGAHIDFMKGIITGEQFHDIVCKKYNHSISIERFKQLWFSILIKQNDGVAEIAAHLHDKYQLAIMSNIDPWHFEYCLKNYHIIGTFKNKFLSYEYHLIKPDPKFFKLVAHQMNVQPKHCILIDDLSENVEAAQKVGYQMIQFKSALNLKQELKKLEIKYDF